MRTSVQPTSDLEETDEFPGCGASIHEDGELIIVNTDSIIEAAYEPGGWFSVTTHAE